MTCLQWRHGKLALWRRRLARQAHNLEAPRSKLGDAKNSTGTRHFAYFCFRGTPAVLHCRSFNTHASKRVFQSISVDVPLLGTIAPLHRRSANTMPFSVDVPHSASTRKSNRWTVIAVPLTGNVPAFVSISMCDCRSVTAMRLSVDTPLVVTVGSFHRRTTSAVPLVVHAPFLRTTRRLVRWTVDAVKPTVAFVRNKRCTIKMRSNTNVVKKALQITILQLRPRVGDAH